MSEKPTIADNFPVDLTLEPGTYWWCACGKSANQPWCDGSHKGSGFSPKKVEITTPGNYSMCACKHSSEAPFCDGTTHTMV